MNVDIEYMTPKARRTRAALLQAARAEIGNGGIAGLNVMAICERARVGRTSFYNYFRNTEALVSTVAEGIAIEIREKFASLHLEVPRGFDRLEACLTMILETAVDDPETMLLVASLSNSGPEIVELLHTEISAELAAFSQLSETDQSLLADYLAQTVLALAQQLAQGKLTRNGIERFVEFMMRACA